MCGFVRAELSRGNVRGELESKNLLDDGLVEVKGGGVLIEGIPSNAQVFLTRKGQRFIEEWIKANEELAY